MSEKRRALGRGLGALIPSAPRDTARPVDVFFRDQDRPVVPREAWPTTPGQHGATSTAEGGAVGGDDPPDQDPGQGLTSTDALEDPFPQVLEHEGLAPVPGATFAELPADAIRPNPKQPRTVFDEDELAELAASIAEIGVLQPIVVRRVVDRTEVPDGVDFELIMGERRLRA